MGKRLVHCFLEAERLGGLVGKMRLASIAQLTSTEAGTIADRAELVERTERALDSLRGEFNKTGPSSSMVPREVAMAPAGDGQAQVLRRHLSVYLDLMAQRSLFMGDVKETMRRVTEAASSTLGVQRVSVWLCDARVQKIACADLFDASGSKHSAGAELSATDFAPYFRALEKERTIAAHDAHNDPRTSCFSASYLKPLGISSLLDVPFWLDERMLGVLCHEHVGPKRTWDSDEETFAYLMSNFIALAYERTAPAA
jgi:transcriptional regulator with GAF, ATPase, and Fis domain